MQPTYARRLARLEQQTPPAEARYIPIQVEGMPARLPPLRSTPFDYATVVTELVQGEPNEPYTTP